MSNPCASLTSIDGSKDHRVDSGRISCTAVSKRMGDQGEIRSPKWVLNVIREVRAVFASRSRGAE